MADRNIHCMSPRPLMDPNDTCTLPGRGYIVWINNIMAWSTFLNLNNVSVTLLYENVIMVHI